jgi:hypothetical protein
MQNESLGICVLCGKRVFKTELYVEAREGYCHKTCLKETTALSKA